MQLMMSHLLQVATTVGNLHSVQLFPSDAQLDPGLVSVLVLLLLFKHNHDGKLVDSSPDDDQSRWESFWASLSSHLGEGSAQNHRPRPVCWQPQSKMKQTNILRLVLDQNQSTISRQMIWHHFKFEQTNQDKTNKPKCPPAKSWSRPTSSRPRSPPQRFCHHLIRGKPCFVCFDSPFCWWPCSLQILNFCLSVTFICL